MHANITVGGQDYRIDLSQPIDISVPLDFDGPQPNAYGIPAASMVPFRAGDFVGSISRGGTVNCFTLTLTPHGNGTHTETASHITSAFLPIGRTLKESFLAASVVTVDITELESSGETYSEGIKGDAVVTRAGLEEGWAAIGRDPTWLEALVIRTLPNHEGKLRASYSNQNPAYLTAQAMQWVRERGVRHLLVDLPSVDREEDSGKLVNHRVFWGFEPEAEELGDPDADAAGRTITELIMVGNHIADGLYVLNLQVPDLITDAAPSRPRLFEARRWPMS